MKLDFFSLSDIAFKYRRNLLFVCSLCFTHFYITPLSEIKLFNLQLPEKLISAGITACLVWFALNYFFSLYSEYVEWKAAHIGELELDSDLRDFSSATIIAEVAVFSERRTELHLTFSNSINTSGDKQKSDVRLNDDTEKLIKLAVDNLRKTIAVDMKRIDIFKNAISHYQIANKFRFYLLDVGVPMMFSILCVYLVINQFFLSCALRT